MNALYIVQHIVQADCTTIFHFVIPAWNFQDMLTIYIASKKSRDTSCNSTGIQDGGQNSKWLPTMYSVVYISLSLRYKICIHIKIYAIRTENSNIWIVSEKKNQDGRQNSKCLSKIDRFDSSKILFCTSVINIWLPASFFSEYVCN